MRKVTYLFKTLAIQDMSLEFHNMSVNTLEFNFIFRVMAGIPIYPFITVK